ncbi:MAG: EscU/YscU/HrcU family type III secretion system export apparatus switch protein [Pirellulales bacterium]
MSDQSQRTIPATPRRREFARQNGLMPLSTLPAWIAAVATAVTLGPLWFAATLPVAKDMTENMIRSAAQDISKPVAFLNNLPLRLFMPTMVVILVSSGVGLIVRMLLDGVSWQSSRIVPSMHRIDVFRGLSRMLSIRTLGMIILHAGTLAVAVVAVYWAIFPLVRSSQSSGWEESVVSNSMSIIGRVQLAMFLLIGVNAAIVSAYWLLSRWHFEKRIRMTPKEFQEEARSLQADPKIKLMRDQMRRPAAMKRSLVSDIRNDE